MKTATPIVASNAPLNELDAVISLLREHVNHGPKVPLTATPAATQAAIDQNEAVLRLIKIILNEKDAPLNKEQNAPKFEDPAEKSAKERAKFKDELHTLAIAQQQEILRISRLKEEREREARIAEEVELNRRAEVKMLGQEAWKVLTGASMINCKTGEQGVERKASKGRLGPRYPSGFSLGAPRRGHSHGGELGINPFWPYGSGKIKRPSGARRVSSPPSENQDEAFFDTEEDLVETPTFASEADSDADKNALEALHNAANLVDACAKKHEIYAEKAAQFKKMEEEARKRESLLEKERHERRHEKEKRHGHLEPEHHGFLNDLLHMNFLSGNAANGGSGSGHTRAPLEHQRSMLDFLHWNRAQPNPVPENSENLRAYMEALAAARAREAAASAARPAPIRRQSRNTFGGGGPTVMQVNVPEVVLPSAALNEKSMAPSDKCGSTTPDSKCETKTVPVHHVSLFGALGGLAYKPIDMIDHIIHPSHYRLSESGAPVASPSRKPVNHDKPGMVSKAVQDLEESELLASMSLSPSKTKKSMKKRDSGVAGVSSSSEGSASEKKAQSAARKHGNLSRAKFENELILQHFENLNNYGNMPQ
ncbi:hypothetical protein BC830DRAFT_286557 [Chytriomyces sp. MP71]|nr:hypothetical protein BC830DRAFT_286557 [Chytriomyces sp. MP71]